MPNINQIKINKYAEETGYTEKAIREKINAGVWIEGVHYSPRLHQLNLLNSIVYRI